MHNSVWTSLKIEKGYVSKTFPHEDKVKSECNIVPSDVVKLREWMPDVTVKSISSIFGVTINALLLGSIDQLTGIKYPW